MGLIDNTLGEVVPDDAVGRLQNYRRIAQLAGMSHSHVSRVMRGHRGATAHTLACIAVAANVRLDILYNYILGPKRAQKAKEKVQEPPPQVKEHYLYP